MFRSVPGECDIENHLSVVGTPEHVTRVLNTVDFLFNRRGHVFRHIKARPDSSR